MKRIAFEAPFVQTLQLAAASEANITIDVLRLDVMHPQISGNKWFKLKGYVADAQKSGKNVIATFGGAYSNHILATAAACQAYDLQSVGIIRGEVPKQYSQTLQDAESFGMQLFFSDRESYRRKKIPEEIFSIYDKDKYYLVNEGGYGKIGCAGAATILDFVNSNHYTHLIAAVGTGTTLAGLASAAKPHQQVLGISVLKNNWRVEDEIKALLPVDNQSFNVIHDYHFGGYAKHNHELIQFMNDWYQATGIPTDFVYTGKLFYAVQQLILEKRFASASKILVVHSGGLQGNRSLPNGTLIFPSF